MSGMPEIESRPADSHKGDYGRLLFIGGCRNMSGAIAMAASAALRSGAGLVSVATAESAQSVVANYNPCYMTVGVEEDPQGRMAVSAEQLNLAVEGLGNFDVLAIGPGMGQSESGQALVTELYREYDGPMVIDADGLNNLQSLEDAAGPRVLTPHPGELKRLANKLSFEWPEIRGTQERLASQLAAEYQVTLVLKGSETLVTDGKDAFYNTTGNPGMATAGSGDVLTGIVAAILAQQFSPVHGAMLSAYLHGLAGDLAVEDIGELSLIATDLIEYLPVAFQQYQGMQ